MQPPGGKNMAMLGGFLFLFAVGSGRLSIDAWLRKASTAIRPAAWP